MKFISIFSPLILGITLISGCGGGGSPSNKETEKTEEIEEIEEIEKTEEIEEIEKTEEIEDNVSNYDFEEEIVLSNPGILIEDIESHPLESTVFDKTESLEYERAIINNDVELMMPPKKIGEYFNPIIRKIIEKN